MKKLIFVICLLFAMCGCGAGESVDGARIQNRGIAVARPGATNHYKREAPYANENRVDTPGEFDMQNALTERRSQAVAESVSKISGVERASVVINNNAAIIGIEISGELDDDALIKLKQNIENEARSVDKHLERVAVTASKELVERISKVADNKTPEKPPVDPDGDTGKVIDQLKPVM